MKQQNRVPVSTTRCIRKGITFTVRIFDELAYQQSLAQYGQGDEVKPKDHMIMPGIQASRRKRGYRWSYAEKGKMSIPISDKPNGTKPFSILK